MGTAENKRSVIVGIFVLLGIIIFGLGIFMLGGQQKRFTKSIQLKTIVANSEGLKVGNNVRFSGVKIGTIKNIEFTGESAVLITFNIEEASQQYIHTDARVKIGSESLIGNTNVVIFGGSPEAPVVKNGDILHAEKTLGTEEMMATLQENNQNLVSITSDFKSITAKMAKGEGTAGALLTDSMMAYNMRQTIANLQQTAATTVKASQALSQFTHRLNSNNGLVNQLLTDTMVFNQLQASVKQLEQTTASAKAMSDNLQQASTKLQQNDNALGLMLNDQEFAAKMKSTMSSLETSSQKLDKNMEALQHSFLLRSYFKKEAKQTEKNKDQDKSFR